MQISFTTQDYGDEAASLAAVARGIPPGSEDHVYGAVILCGDDGTQVAVKDDLLFLVPDLCAEAPATLEAGRTAHVTLVDQPNEWHLVRNGDNVTLYDEQGGRIILPYNELLPMLRDCGRRFAAFIDALAGLQTEFAWAARKFAAKAPE